MQDVRRYRNGLNFSVIDKLALNVYPPDADVHRQNGQFPCRSARIYDRVIAGGGIRQCYGYGVFADVAAGSVIADRSQRVGVILIQTRRSKYIFGNCAAVLYAQVGNADGHLFFRHNDLGGVPVDLIVRVFLYIYVVIASDRLTGSVFGIQIQCVRYVQTARRNLVIQNGVFAVIHMNVGNGYGYFFGLYCQLGIVESDFVICKNVGRNSAVFGKDVQRIFVDGVADGISFGTDDGSEFVSVRQSGNGRAALIHELVAVVYFLIFKSHGKFAFQYRQRIRTFLDVAGFRVRF